MSEVDIKDVTNGSMDGAKVWVCDLRYRDYTQKPIRNVLPTEVIVVPNEGKLVYYSNSHFRTIKKDGGTSSKVINPYDHTGFRSYAGEPLNVFDNREECVAMYKEQLDKAIYHIYDAMRIVEEKAHKLEKIKEALDECR